MFTEMKPKPFVTVFALLVVCAAACFAVPAENSPPVKGNDQPISKEEIQRYMTILQNLNIEQIVNNDRLMANNAKCFLNEGPCTSQLKDLKKLIPLLVKDSCSSCTSDQKKMIKKTMDTIKARRPKVFEKLSKVFDPEGVYQKKFMDNLKEAKR